MKSTEEELNYELYKEDYHSNKKRFRKMLKAIISASPRSILIKVLKEKKIISNEYCLKGDKLIMVEKRC